MSQKEAEHHTYTFTPWEAKLITEVIGNSPLGTTMGELETMLEIKKKFNVDGSVEQVDANLNRDELVKLKQMLWHVKGLPIHENTLHLKRKFEDWTNDTAPPGD